MARAVSVGHCQLGRLRGVFESAGRWSASAPWIRSSGVPTPRHSAAGSKHTSRGRAFGRVPDACLDRAHARPVAPPERRQALDTGGDRGAPTLSGGWRRAEPDRRATRPVGRNGVGAGQEGWDRPRPCPRRPRCGACGDFALGRESRDERTAGGPGDRDPKRAEVLCAGPPRSPAARALDVGDSPRRPLERHAVCGKGVSVRGGGMGGGTGRTRKMAAPQVGVIPPWPCAPWQGVLVEGSPRLPRTALPSAGLSCGSTALPTCRQRDVTSLVRSHLPGSSPWRCRPHPHASMGVAAEGGRIRYTSRRPSLGPRARGMGTGRRRGRLARDAEALLRG